MRLKMNQNSLFALLLRSPWWVSMLIAAVMVALAMALLPELYKLVGALSATPLVVVGLVAAKRQWGRPSSASIDNTATALAAMPWPAFAELLVKGFERGGHSVQRENSEVVDFVLQRQGRSTLVLAKRWKSARIGLETLRALQAERARRDAAEAMLVCLDSPSDSARDFARQQNITLCQAAGLAQLLHGVPLTAPAARQKAKPAK